MNVETISHYRILKKIGEGGMGEVYLAHDTKLNREVAIKVLPDGFAQDAERVARFQREAQVLASLNHPSYMSPEQAKGKAVDRRADIWAFGCVLFEMLSGEQAFSGETLTDTLAAVVRAEPEWDALPPATPDAIRRLLRRCLTKDPKQRLRDIGEARIVLGEPHADAADVKAARALPPAAQSAWKRFLPWTLVVLLAAGLALTYVLRASKSLSLLRSSISHPRGFSLDLNNSSLALSPDGRRLVIAAAGDDGKGQQLWLRSMDSLTIQPLAGTIGATYPFWSPDCRYVGFFADQKLKKTDISSGLVQILCDAVEGRGASWSRQDIIVFAPQAIGSLFEVAAAGGTPAQVTSVESNDVTHRLPHFLPDGERLLFFSGKTAASEKDKGIYSLDLGTKKVALVARESSEGIYVEPGSLVFVRNGNLKREGTNSM